MRTVKFLVRQKKSHSLFGTHMIVLSRSGTHVKSIWCKIDEFFVLRNNRFWQKNAQGASGQVADSL